MLRNACVLRKFHFWFQPKLSLLIIVEDMDMHPFFLIRVYLKRIFAFASEYWTHNCFDSFFVCKYTEIFGKFQIIIEIFLLTPYL